MKQIQEEHAEWLAREYPGQHPLFPACGLVEEAGELMHALLKLNQETVWGADPRYAGVAWQNKLVDAIGDCALFACSLCNTKGWDFAELCLAASAYREQQLTAMEAAAFLVKSAADVVLLPCEGSLLKFLAQLQALCSSWGIRFEEAVRVTWAEVKERKRVVAAN